MMRIIIGIILIGVISINLIAVVRNTREGLDNKCYKGDGSIVPYTRPYDIANKCGGLHDGTNVKWVDNSGCCYMIRLDEPTDITSAPTKILTANPTKVLNFIKKISTENHAINEILHSKDIYNAMNAFTNNMSTKISGDLRKPGGDDNIAFIDSVNTRAPALILRTDKPDMIAYNNINPNGGGNSLNHPFLMDTNYTEDNISEYPISSEYQLSSGMAPPYESAWAYINK